MYISIHCVVVGIFVAAVAGGFEVGQYIWAIEQDGFSLENLCMYVLTDKHWTSGYECCLMI